MMFPRSGFPGKDIFVDATIDWHEENESCEAKSMKDYTLKIIWRTFDQNLSARDDGLSGIFPPTIGCLFEDLDESLAGDAPLEFGSIHIESLERMLRDFKNAFTLDRYYHMYGLVKYYLDILEHPIVELKEYFNNPESSPLSHKRAGIHLQFIKEHLELLAQVAREIDQISR
jgi:hypothetical protein